ncbi:hypothetical protein BU24DRAFT_493436 [Aaosphaeria arxii CBS 175.79]|uniref:Uncharacterized protein n=1 Tax=Aaosphaeria arxii CBS 175.79 TaxID=1450172 RepID=A0A6A5XPV0_9PLEO|nr:uncharacterized protein BU24DRAFT_493436 [Aaosphaeria arxii CBS 175.79]KAF2014936.1 hypothetical protein BU24DRAFT_493436 [Aaosphaeria arxii CBS 175.79]
MDASSIRPPIKARRDSHICDLRNSDMVSLPEELIEAILRYVQHTGSTAEFWACLRTCQQWHRIGLGLHRALDVAVCTTIESTSRRMDFEFELDRSDIKLVTDFELGFSKLFTSMLRSLTVHIVHSRIKALFRPVRGKNLIDSLITSFAVADQLTTFSFKFADEGWDFPSMDVPAFPASRLADMVAALPETVVNLEIDTAGTDITLSDSSLEKRPNRHLCHQIANIFPRLEYLRLRVGHVCKTLMPVPPDMSRDNPTPTACSLCGRDDRSGCSIARSWNMRQIVVYIPWGFKNHDLSFTQTMQPFLLLHPPHPSFVIIHQDDWAYPSRMSITSPTSSPYTNFSMTTHSNLLRPDTITGYINWLPPSSPPQPPSHPLKPTHSPTRYLTPTRQSTPRTTHPYLTTWTLESSTRWTQLHHLGPRHPIALASTPTSPFHHPPDLHVLKDHPNPHHIHWAFAHAPAASTSPAFQASFLRAADDDDDDDTQDEMLLYPCLFPACRERCEDIEHLLGHVVYRHPDRPHRGSWFGRVGCAFVGCDRIGSRGFGGREELEGHLRGHGWVGG